MTNSFLINNDILDLTVEYKNRPTCIRFNTKKYIFIYLS